MNESKTVYALINEALGDVELTLESYNVPFLREAHRDLSRVVEAIQQGKGLFDIVRGD